MTNLQCPKYLNYTPDEVAECLDVSEVTYIFLWNEIVPKVEQDQKKDNHVKDYTYVAQYERDFDRDYYIKSYWKYIPNFIKEDIIKAFKKHNDRLADLGFQQGRTAPISQL